MSALAPKQICAVMSALGQKRTVAVQQSMSAFRPKRTFQSALRNGGFNFEEVARMAERSVRLFSGIHELIQRAG
jgi:hypothetical protein